MTLFQLWDIVSYIAGKFPNAGAFPPSRFNLLLPQAQDEFIEGILRGIMAANANKELYAKVMNSSPLVPFKKTSPLTVDQTSGVADLPDDYLQYIGAFSTAYAENNVSVVMPTRVVEIVSENEFAERRGDICYLFDTFPFAKIAAGKFNIIPFNYYPQLEYFRKPATPYFDYCQGSVNPNQIVYMPVGSNVHGGNLYSSSGAVLRTGVTKWENSTPVVTYTSKTVELEWNDTDQWRLVYLILSKVGVNLGEGEVEKYALQMQQQ